MILITAVLTVVDVTTVHVVVVWTSIVCVGTFPALQASLLCLQRKYSSLKGEWYMKAVLW